MHANRGSVQFYTFCVRLRAIGVKCLLEKTDESFRLLQGVFAKVSEMLSNMKAPFFVCEWCVFFIYLKWKFHFGLQRMHLNI